MKRLTIITLLISVLLCGCTPQAERESTPDSVSAESPHESSGTIESEDDKKPPALSLTGKEYLISDGGDNLGSVEIAVFEGESAQALKNVQIETIFRFFPKQGYDGLVLTQSKQDVDKSKDYKEAFFDLDCKVTLFSDDIVSIVYSGSIGAKDSAHPSSLFTTLNVDAKTCKPISISDLYHTDSRMYDVITESAAPFLEKAWGSGWKDIELGTALCSREDFERTLKDGNDIITYFTQDGIGFSFSVLYALGEHVEIEVSLDKLEHLKK